jgi:SAM-dependent methyltransferase
MLRGTHTERARAQGFGVSAATYDQTRPSYPTELVEWLSRNGTGTAVDVGCGTGRVAALLARAGWKVMGVDPDPRMADVARTRGVEVICAPFETCALPRGKYDLVCSGTAWHWVDPDVGYDVAAGLLRRGGQLAVFRNGYRYDPPVARVIDSALRRHAPVLLDVPLGTASGGLIETHEQEMNLRAKLFAEVTHRTFVHQREVSVNDWISELATHSPIQMLDRATREAFLEELACGAAASTGDSLRIWHETPCVVAERL